MKAVAVFPAERAVRLIEEPEPVLRSPTDVLVRLLEVGVCGTDREICAFDYGTPPAGSDALVIGHEALGEVVATGRAVTGLAPGDLVVPMVRRPCPHARCVACGEERQDFCYTGDFVERGIKGRHGFMTERIVEDARWLVPLPRHLREVGVLVEPLTIAEKALAQIWQVQQRLPWACPMETRAERGSCRHALVLGAGPVGLLGAMALRVAGFNTTVYSRDEETSRKARLMEEIGARYVSSARTPVAALPELLGAIDVVYEATGASGLSFEVLSHLGPNAVFVFTGVPGRKGPVAVDTDRLMRNLVLKNQIVFGTVNAGRETFEAAVDDLGVFAERWPEAVRSLITGRHPVERFQDLLVGPAEGIKNVIVFG